LSTTIKAIRGMHDIAPDEVYYWQYLEHIAQRVFESYGYREIRFPIVENTDLFKRSIGDITDIVEKEMYTFEDRNGDSLTLRPEGTASCVRAGIECGLLYNQIQRLWYVGPMFRHERPQKGRYRQFHQFGLEVFGLSGPDIDAEIILITAKLWEKLGLTPFVSLQLNSLGTPESRKKYYQALVDYFSAHLIDLDEDSQRRLHSNPMRILDSKVPQTQNIVKNAPLLETYLDEHSVAHFQGLMHLLDTLGVTYQVNPRLVRGLDYYTNTVFEWVTSELGAQGTVCAGGRYDNLVSYLGGHATPAVGFAMGVERLILMLKEKQTVTEANKLDAYMVMVGDQTLTAGMVLAEKIRHSNPEFNLICHCGGGGFKSQMKKADRSGARWAFIIGDDELKMGTVTMKWLREHGEQRSFSQPELMEFVSDYATKNET